MRYPKDHKNRSREHILDAAARVFRRQGYVGGGVSAVMGEAGMTKGGFSAHFENKEELFAQALTKALGDAATTWSQGVEDLPDRDWIEMMVQRYLSDEHLQMVEDGCPLPALLSEIGRAGPAPRAAFEAHLLKMLVRIGERLPPATGEQRQDAAVAILATLIGGMAIARSVADPQLSERVLRACREFIIEHLPDQPEQESPTG